METSRAFAPRLRLEVVSDGESDIPHQKIETPESAAEVMRMHLKRAPDEHGVVILLDVNSMLVGALTVAMGSTDSCPVKTKNILRAAIVHPTAYGIIFGHNHPSGKALPSEEDKAFFKRLRRAADDQDVRILDLLIVGDRSGELYSHRRSTFEL